MSEMLTDGEPILVAFEALSYEPRCPDFDVALGHVVDQGGRQVLVFLRDGKEIEDAIGWLPAPPEPLWRTVFDHDEGDVESGSLVERRLIDILRKSAVKDAGAIAGASKAAYGATQAAMGLDEVAQEAVSLLRAIARGRVIDNLSEVAGALDARRVTAMQRIKWN